MWEDRECDGFEMKEWPYVLRGDECFGPQY